MPLKILKSIPLCVQTIIATFCLVVVAKEIVSSFIFYSIYENNVLNLLSKNKIVLWFWVCILKHYPGTHILNTSSPPSSVKVSLKLLKSNLSNLLRLMGDILYIVCKYNSFLPNPDSVELDFLQRIKSVHIAFLVLNGDFWSFGWLFVWLSI